MTLPVYGAVVLPVAENKIIVAGGYNSYRGESNLVNLFDLQSGQVSNMKGLTNTCWTSTTAYYFANNIYVFHHGEETDEKMPGVIKYYIEVPLY